MDVYRKNTVRWTLKGKRVLPNTPKAVKKRFLRFVGTARCEPLTASGRRFTGTLFRGFDQRTSGPMDLRFKWSVSNAIRNIAENKRAGRHYLPAVPIGQEFVRGGVTADELPARSWTADDEDEKVIDDFRRLLRDGLGSVAVAVLDRRLAGEETKSLVGSPEVGGAGRDAVKRIVRNIKRLAQEFAGATGDSELLRRIEKAMASEEATVGKWRTATAARRVVGAASAKVGA